MKRNTIQHLLVLETVNKLQCHATADEIYRAIVKEHPNISRATVGADRVAHICYDHCHVQCEKGGRLFDVDMDFVSGLEKNIRDDHGFTFTGYDIIFRGVCPDCKKLSEKQSD